MTPRKNSKKRGAILECIRSTKTHPSAEWIYTQLKPRIPDLSLGTVYRNLNLFKQEGQLISVGVVNGLERFDAFHLYPLRCCDRCRRHRPAGASDLPSHLRCGAGVRSHLYRYL